MSTTAPRSENRTTEKMLINELIGLNEKILEWFVLKLFLSGSFYQNLLIKNQFFYFLKLKISQFCNSISTSPNWSFRTNLQRETLLGKGKDCLRQFDSGWTVILDYPVFVFGENSQNIENVNLKIKVITTCFISN